MVRDYIEVLPPNECQTCHTLDGVAFGTLTLPKGVRVSESCLFVCQTCKREYIIRAVVDESNNKMFNRVRFKVSRKENEQ